jgi:transcriptional regulator with GAF, ATPase, and Fis domain
MMHLLSASSPMSGEDATALGQLQRLDESGAGLLGLVCVDLAQNCLKRAMLREALRRTHGNFTKTASLLGVKRQAVQHMVSRYELREWAAGIRGER